MPGIQVEGRQKPMNGTLRFSVLFNHKGKVAFGRLDSASECAKNFPMEKRTKCKINDPSIRAPQRMQSTSHLKHSETKRESLRSDVPSSV